MKTRIINHPVRRKWNADDTVSLICIGVVIAAIAWASYMLVTIDERRAEHDAKCDYQYYLMEQGK